MKMKSIILLVLVILLVANVSADASFVTRQTGYTNSKSYYGSAGIETYWPILGKGESCEARQDVILQVSPAGCQPVVVRSDLLEEQNVPVFCQLDALKINPLIDVNKIKNIHFVGEKPKEVIDIGFHPARAALRTQDKLLGSPLINNVGYIVVVLRKNPNEKDMPDMVKLNLQAEITYDSDNAFGVGKSQMFLDLMNNNDWEVEGNRQTIWNGRYFIRLDEAEADRIAVSIYDGDKRISSNTINKGSKSEDIYLPGGYCSAGLNIEYDGFVAAQEKARIKVDDEILEVYSGSRFLNDKCVVQDVIVNDFDGTGKIEVKCGRERVDLSLSSSYSNVAIEVLGFEPIIPEGTKFETNSVRGIFPLVSAEVCEVELDDATGKAGFYSIARPNLISGLAEKTGFRWELFYRDQNDGAFISKENFLGDEFLSNLKKELIAKCEGKKTLLEKTYNDADLEMSFNKSIENYEGVVEDYSSETFYDNELSSTYGEKALGAGISLAAYLNKKATEIRLRREMIDNYPENAQESIDELNRLINYNVDKAEKIVNVDNSFHTVKLLSLTNPSSEQANADFIYAGDKFNLKAGESYAFDSQSGQGIIKVLSLRIDSARVNVVCPSEVNTFPELGDALKKIANQDRETQRKGLSKIGSLLFEKLSFLPIRSVPLDGSIDVCDGTLELVSTSVHKVASIRVIPKAFNTESISNLTVGVGIEKRAIQLSPEKAQEKIDNLNETIHKWEGISNNLGNFVTGLKTACFATSAVLTAKNFLSGLDGESIARQKVMRGEGGWNEKCAGLVKSGQYVTQRACYLDKANVINADISAYKGAIDKVNENIKKVETPYKSSELLGTSVNRDKAAKDYADDLLNRYKGETVNGTKIEDLIVKDGYEKGYYKYDQLREIETNIILSKSNNPDIVNRANKELGVVSEDIRDNIKVYSEVDKANALDIPQAYKVDLKDRRTILTEVDRKGTSGISGTVFGAKEDVSSVSTIVVSAKNGFAAGTYLLGLKEESGGNYAIIDAAQIDASTGNEIAHVTDMNKFTGTYNLGLVKKADVNSYRNKYSDPKVSYFETEPYKGLPAIVPFDIQNGWYVATKQTLPAFGAKGPFDSSGRVAVFWLCNVGVNGREQFNEGLGDDICQRIDLDTGQSLGVFPGLSEAESRKKVEQGIKAIQDASNQYGKKVVNILGEPFEVGLPATNLPGTECEDFMSPEDCQILFNVCDPVICPNSRCDFGGKYPVADVVQSGIVGSALLCLPNVREGIAIPVCLTGIKAGVDSYLSILKSHQQCLQENIDTGRTVGICDEITSIYACEFFWRQAAPLANVLLPKTVELLAGQGTRGGGEYAGVTSAWENAQGSVNYFTNYYGSNALAAFKIRSVDEAGGTFCKAFVSAKAPSALEILTEPDSPPQFSAWFSSIPFNDATLPPTAQYKVFYHIFAGNDAGISYQVYLKDPPENSYYYSTSSIPVAANFIPKGEFATDTIDFTAPEGYKQLCVVINGQEECGFKQVSTSFAVNYLRDSFVSGEIERTDVQSEKECISGGTNLAALSNPNPQAIGEEALNPEIYNRGVSRICATDNPGIGTNLDRFVDVGYCDSDRIRCWLDKESVDKAITDSNLGIKNSTLQQLDKQQQDNFIRDGFLGRTEGENSLKDIRTRLNQINVRDMTFQLANKLLDELEIVEEGLLFNDQKANALLLRGQIYDKLVRSLFVSGGFALTVTPDETAPVVDNSKELEQQYLDSIQDYYYNIQTDLNGNRYVFVEDYPTGVFIERQVSDLIPPQVKINYRDADNFAGKVENGVINVDESHVRNQLLKEGKLIKILKPIRDYQATIAFDLNGKSFQDLYDGKVKVSPDALAVTIWSSEELKRYEDFYGRKLESTPEPKNNAPEEINYTVVEGLIPGIQTNRTAKLIELNRIYTGLYIFGGDIWAQSDNPAQKYINIGSINKRDEIFIPGDSEFMKEILITEETLPHIEKVRDKSYFDLLEGLVRS